MYRNIQDDLEDVSDEFAVLNGREESDAICKDNFHGYTAWIVVQ